MEQADGKSILFARISIGKSANCLESMMDLRASYDSSNLDWAAISIKYTIAFADATYSSQTFLATSWPPRSNVLNFIPPISSTWEVGCWVGAMAAAV